MSDRLADMRHIRFLLYEIFDVESLTQYEHFADHSKETFEMALETGYKLAREVFWPAYQPFDREGIHFKDGHVTTPAGMKEIWKQCKEGGWFAPGADYDYGGQQFPHLLTATTSYLFNCANTSAYMYVGSAAGAALLIEKYGTDEQKAEYLEKLYSGTWGGTMCLTEPQAGSSLGDITTTAVPENGHFKIRGVKRFISSGDHDLAENIVHPVLAKLPGAPPGVKGISLFLVPKYRLDGTYNDVATAGVEHKLGLRAQATATLNFGEKDDCHGWLLGAENRGLECMFALMNGARIHTGIQAVAGASAAYQCALQYTQERLQGRSVSSKDPSAEQAAIIKHPDVRRMLLHQKAFVEGNLSLLLFTAKLSDIRHASTDEAEQQRAHLLLEILTPIAKAHCSDGAFESIRLALQCYGGAGFCEEFPVAQMLRDNKVYSIYEGTNGIQAMDLLGRKVPMNGGEALRALIQEISETIDAARKLEPLKEMAQSVEDIQNTVAEVTMHLGAIGMSGDREMYICNASDYLDMFSAMVIGWQHLQMATAAQKALDAGSDDKDFYTGVVKTASYYCRRSIPKALAIATILKSNERTALDYEEAWF
ncbi:MAG: acyl-CoA dehydrogenase [Candidatus Hydrogenedentes bacterium]|nr:acyl-CoA dehydrogenase [Candidatus Hydrogenedentota bacterium]